MFNLVDTGSGDKVDFWILTSSPFDEECFRRRVKVALFGVAVWVPSPEDVILSKLDWSALAGGSEKQFQDALRVYEVQRANLDVSGRTARCQGDLGTAARRGRQVGHGGARGLLL